MLQTFSRCLFGYFYLQGIKISKEFLWNLKVIIFSNFSCKSSTDKIPKSAIQKYFFNTLLFASCQSMKMLTWVKQDSDKLMIIWRTIIGNWFDFLVDVSYAVALSLFTLNPGRYNGRGGGWGWKLALGNEDLWKK